MSKETQQGGHAAARVSKRERDTVGWVPPSTCSYWRVQHTHTTSPPHPTVTGLFMSGSCGKRGWGRGASRVRSHRYSRSVDGKGRAVRRRNCHLCDLHPRAPVAATRDASMPCTGHLPPAASSPMSIQPALLTSPFLFCHPIPQPISTPAWAVRLRLPGQQFRSLCVLYVQFMFLSCGNVWAVALLVLADRERSSISSHALGCL